MEIEATKQLEKTVSTALLVKVADRPYTHRKSDGRLAGQYVDYKGSWGTKFVKGNVRMD